MNPETNSSYDATSRDSILDHARKISGKTLQDIYGVSCKEKVNNGKGRMGDLVERLHFRLERNNQSKPDFVDANLELKTTGVRTVKNGRVTAKERLTLSMIDYGCIAKETFYTSKYLSKNAYILIMVYRYDKERGLCQREFITSFIFTIPEEDKPIFQRDWEYIQLRVSRGEAHLLSESDTSYLGAATKGSSASDVRVQMDGAPLAMRRAFCIKRNYLDYIIQMQLGNVANKPKSLESTKSDSELELTIEEVVLSRINKRKGSDKDSLAKEFGIKSTRSKHWASQLAKRMLGLGTKDEVAEFLKAGINIKTVTTKDGKTVKEAMSFAQIDYHTLSDEQWEDSYWHSVVTNKFLVVVFDKVSEDNQAVFKGAFFWSLPVEAQEEAQLYWSTLKDLVNQSKFAELYRFKSPTLFHVRDKARNSKHTMVVGNNPAVKKMAYWINRRVIADVLRREGFL